MILSILMVVVFVGTYLYMSNIVEKQYIDKLCYMISGEKPCDKNGEDICIIDNSDIRHINNEVDEVDCVDEVDDVDDIDDRNNNYDINFMDENIDTNIINDTSNTDVLNVINNDVHVNQNVEPDVDIHEFELIN